MTIHGAYAMGSMLNYNDEYTPPSLSACENIQFVGNLSKEDATKEFLGKTSDRSFTMSFDQCENNNKMQLINAAALEYGFTKYRIIKDPYLRVYTIMEVTTPDLYISKNDNIHSVKDIEAERLQEVEFERKVKSIYEQLGIVNNKVSHGSAGYWRGVYTQLCCHPQLIIDKVTNEVTVALGYKVVDGMIVNDHLDIRIAIIYFHKIVDKWVEFNKLFSKEVKDECGENN